MPSSSGTTSLFIVSFVQENPRQSMGRRNASKISNTCMINTFWAWFKQVTWRKGRLKAAGYFPSPDQVCRGFYVPVTAHQQQRACITNERVRRRTRAISNEESHAALAWLACSRFSSCSNHKLQRFNVYVNLSNLNLFYQRAETSVLQTFLKRKLCSPCITWIILALNGFYGYWYGDVFYFVRLRESYTTVY